MDYTMIEETKIRLECAKIAASLDLPPERVVEIAKALWEFVSNSPNQCGENPETL